MNILTYNVRGTRGIDDIRSVERIVDTIRSSQADIVCLQEVEQWEPGVGFGNQPADLARLLAMHVEFHGILTLPHYRYGIAILTRYPVVQSDRYLLPSVGEQRGMIRVQISTEQGDLSVFCTHWGLNGEERIKQAGETAAAINATTGPKIICGDLNETADHAAVSTLISLTGLRDLAIESGHAEFTFSSDTPDCRIDYMLASRELTASNVTVINSQASDHRPVLASGVGINSDGS
ncbi:MAG: endonuclease/exonuclease/phosphatase family protein [Armatimonadota bacterium]